MRFYNLYFNEIKYFKADYSVLEYVGLSSDNDLKYSLLTCVSKVKRLK